MVKDTILVGDSLVWLDGKVIHACDAEGQTLARFSCPYTITELVPWKSSSFLALKATFTRYFFVLCV